MWTMYQLYHDFVLMFLWDDDDDDDDVDEAEEEEDADDDDDVCFCATPKRLDVFTVLSHWNDIP